MVPFVKVFSYWSGPITWMEHMSIASAQATGHQVTVFSHDPQVLRRGALDCEVLNAGELLSDPALNRLRRMHPAHYTDHLRLVGLQRSLGTWIDLDLVFLRPLPADPYLMGWEIENSVCNAVLRLPPSSPILTEYIEICSQRPVPLNVPWAPLKERIQRQIKRVPHLLRGKMIAPMLGPKTLTHLIFKHGLTEHVKPREVFYPAPFGRVNVTKMAEPGYFERVIGSETVTVHLWRSMFRKVFGDEIPSDWLRQKLARVSA